MTWMNEWDIEEAIRKFKKPETPNLYDGITIIDKLAAWTNHYSDGWHSWPKPSNAANSLMELLQRKDPSRPWAEKGDVTEAEIDKAVAPIKAFLTRMEKTPFGLSSAAVEDAIALRTWIVDFLKTSRSELARRLI